MKWRKACRRLARTPSEVQVDIENPAGILSATIEGTQTNSETKITRAAYKRSAQILARGYVPVYRASPALKQALAEAAADHEISLIKRAFRMCTIHNPV